MAEIHHLMVRTACPEPAVEAAAQSRSRPELAVRHLQRGQRGSVQDLALRYDQAEPGSLQRRERGQGGWSWLVLEQERGRVCQAADAERPLDQPDRLVGPCHFPVAL